MVFNKIGKGIKKGVKAVEDNTIGQVRNIVRNLLRKIKELLDIIPRKVAEFVKAIPKKVLRIFKPLLQKLVWILNWFKTLCLCSCLLCLASSCFSLGLPQMMISIVQGAGSVAASQAVDGTNGGSNTSNNINLSEFDLNGLNINDSSNAGSLDALPTSMAMFNARPTTSGPSVGSVRMAIPTGPSTNNMPNFSKNLSK